MHYLVVEAGTHTLPNGTRWAAGITPKVKDRYKRQPLPPVFSATPVMLVQCASDNHGGSVVSRINHRQTSAQEARLRLQAPEGSGSISQGEDVHWIAMEAGIQASGQAFEAQVSGRQVRHTWYTLGFQQSYGPQPIFLSFLNSRYGGDPSGMRYRHLNANGVAITVEEENCGDSETNHTTETVGYVVFEQAGMIEGRQGQANVVQQFGFLNPRQSVEEADAEVRMRAFPNPATHFIDIQLSGLSKNQASSLEVLDFSGRVVKRTTFSGLRTQVAVNDLPEGMYVLRVQSGSLKQTLRFVKQP